MANGIPLDPFRAPQVAPFDLPAELPALIPAPVVEVGAVPELAAGAAPDTIPLLGRELLPAPARAPVEPTFDIPSLAEAAPLLPAPTDVGLPAGPAPAPVAPPALQVRPTLAPTLTEVNRLSAQQTALVQRGRDIAVKLGQTSDPKERAVLETQAEDTMRGQQVASADLNTARSEADIERTLAAQQLEDEQRRLQTNSLLDARGELQERAATDALADARLVERQDRAREDTVALRESYTQIVEQGPKQSIALTAVSMIAEALAARNARREPDFNKVFQSLVAQSRSTWEAKQQAAIQRVRIGDDAVANIARERQEQTRQNAARDDAYMQGVILQLDRTIAESTDEAQRAGAIDVRDRLTRQQEQLRAEAESAAAERARREQRENLQDELTAAKIAKERAAAAKLARRGRGRKVADAAAIKAGFRAELRDLAASGKEGKRLAETLNKRGVFDPFSGKLLKNPDGSFAQVDDPKVLRTTIAANATSNELIEEIIALRAKHGSDIGRGNFFTKDPAGLTMTSKAKQLLAELNKGKGLGALDEGSVTVLQGMLGGEPGAWGDPTPALRTLQQDSIDGLNKTLRSQGLTAAVTLPVSRAAPKRTLADVEVLSRGDIGRDGRIAGADDRLAAKDEELELLIAEGAGSRNPRAFGTEVWLERASKDIAEAQAKFDEIDARILATDDEAAKAQLRRSKRAQRDYIIGLNERVVANRKKLAAFKLSQGDRSSLTPEQEGKLVERDARARAAATRELEAIPPGARRF